MNKVDFSANFSTNDTFHKHCLSLSQKQIQNMSTKDWLKFYSGMNSLCERLGNNPNEFMKKHLGALAYLYHNYRSPKETSRKIKELAYKVADSLATSEEFAKLYYEIDIMSYKQDYKQFAKILRKSVYEKAFRGRKFSALMMPKLKIKKSNEMHCNGVFTMENSHKLPVIKLRECGVDFCNTTAHELFHSLQTLKDTSRIKLLSKIGIKFSSDKETEELYRLNHKYYLPSEISNNFRYNGYEKQPLEWGARFFATCFERRLRKNLRAEKNNWNLLYQTTQILRKMEIYDRNATYNKSGVEIIVNIFDKKDESIIRELGTKYVKKGYTLPTGSSALLHIDRNTQTFINISNLYNELCKAEEKGIGRKELIKKFFPMTYDTFYRNRDEKRIQSSFLDKIKINRSR